MSEKTWADGMTSGAFKNKGNKKKVKHRSGKTPRVGIHARRMARRRG